MTDQISFGQFSFDPNNNFADNAEPRCPLVLLLDVSGSMSGAPLQALNEGLVTLKDELAADSLAMKRVEISIVTFGPAQIHTPFTSASSFYPPVLTAQGDTPMGEAIRQGVELVRQRKEDLPTNGTRQRHRCGRERRARSSPSSLLASRAPTWMSSGKSAVVHRSRCRA